MELERRERPLTSQTKRRVSDRGFLPQTEDQSLALLDWTGCQIRSDKPGTIPAQLAPILKRLQVSTNSWVDLVAGFGRWFHRTVGRPSSMEEAGKRRGARWLHGIARAREAFVEDQATTETRCGPCILSAARPVRADHEFCALFEPTQGLMRAVGPFWQL